MEQAGTDAANRSQRMRELDYAMEHPGSWNLDKLDDYERESDAIYKELYPNAWFQRVLDLQRIADGSSSVYYDYYNRTAGEIEARDTEQRIDLTQTERKEKRPDIDRTDVVFVDIGGVSYSSPKEVREWNISWDPNNFSDIKDQLRAHLEEVNQMDPVASVTYDKTKQNY